MLNKTKIMANILTKVTSIMMKKIDKDDSDYTSMIIAKESSENHKPG